MYFGIPFVGELKAFKMKCRANILQTLNAFTTAPFTYL